MVLQLPRGNLEAIRPRALVLPAVAGGMGYFHLSPSFLLSFSFSCRPRALDLPAAVGAACSLLLLVTDTAARIFQLRSSCCCYNEWCRYCGTVAGAPAGVAADVS